MYMTVTVTKKKLKTAKVPTHILLDASAKKQAMAILRTENTTLSAFFQKQVENLIKTQSQKLPKQRIIIDMEPLENSLPLEKNDNPYDYNINYETITDSNAKATISLSFSQRQRLGYI
jgi:septum formation inhibitor MinC